MRKPLNLAGYAELKNIILRCLLPRNKKRWSSERQAGLLCYYTKKLS
ncbi:MAG: hypothetical protein ACYDG2_04530 [Ruminiclostridium sp.]